jgi:hypothetical protein
MTKLKNPGPKSSITGRGVKTAAAAVIAVDSREGGACR